MSYNQSRDAQLRKPARSGSGHHRDFGGRGAGAAGGYASPGGGGAATANSVAHPPSPNRSFKKQGHGQVWQRRVNPASGRAVQNEVHLQSNSRVASEASGQQAVKQMEGTTSRISRPIPRPPPSQPAGGESTAPVKPTKGDSSSSFTLQFGSINVGFVHGLQVPARTSSAPLSLDEQKRDQVRHNSLRAGIGPSLPLASVPKPQQQPKKDKADRNHPDLVNSYPQNFERLFQQVKEVKIDNVDTLVGVVFQIFDKALMEPTFCEMYADFCLYLSVALPDFSRSDNERITFRRLLLNMCQEEFERGEKEEGELKQNAEEREQKNLLARRRKLGNIRLIGELYKKRMLTERIINKCIFNLLGQPQNPDEEES